MLRTTTAVSSAFLCLLVGIASAADPGEAVTDPAQGGPDFAAQGEYCGAMSTSNGEFKLGVQVIALGDGKFRAVAYPGGLPGDGWNGKDKQEVDGERVDGVVTFRTENGGTATIADDVLTATSPDGEKSLTFKKVHRESPTLGAKPPARAVVLFDGSSPGAFRGGRMTDDGLLMQGVTSKQKFQSFRMHLEFRTPFKPDARGQGRGNSGFYAQGRYEVQILDSFGLEGEQNECGGIYSIAKPSLNMCFPPLSWQTYDVEFTTAEYRDGKKVKDAVMTVRHNGTVIHQDVTLGHKTTAAPVDEGPEPGPIYLQDHGAPIRFRNIWVVEK